MLLDRMEQKKGVRGNVGFYSLVSFVLVNVLVCTMKERRQAGVHKFTFVRWKEWVYWARSCHASSL